MSEASQEPEWVMPSSIREIEVGMMVRYSGLSCYRYAVVQKVDGYIEGVFANTEREALTFISRYHASVMPWDRLEYKKGWKFEMSEPMEPMEPTRLSCALDELIDDD